MRLTNVILDHESAARKQIMKSFIVKPEDDILEKAHVKSYARHSKSGKLSQVKEHEDKRASKRAWDEKQKKQAAKISPVAGHHEKSVEEMALEAKKQKNQSPVFGMRRFTKEDYYGYGGAEKFDDGTEPLIGTMKVNGEIADVVGSKGIIGVMVAEKDEEGEDDIVNYRYPARGDIDLKQPMMMVVLKHLMEKGSMTTKELQELGFEPLG
jgi:hypothetical protein